MRLFYLLCLSACSLPVEHAIGSIAAVTGEHCGWVEAPHSPYAPEASCQLATCVGPCGLLPAGADPCDSEPVAELDVPAGQIHSGWHRLDALSTPYEITEWDVACATE